MKATMSTLQHLYNQGHQDLMSLVQLTGIPRRTVSRTLSKLRQGLSLERKKGSGRPKLINSNDRRRLIQLAKKNNTSSARELQTEMVKRGSPSVAPRTIRSYLNRAGYFSLVPKTQPLLTPTHKLNRVKWCKDHQKTRWSQWVFSDESRFELFRCRAGRWAKERPRIGKPKFSPSLMIWGAISLRGKSILVKVRGSIDSIKYQEILTVAEPSIKQLYPRSFTFQQDGASSHTSKSTLNWFEANQWKVSPWPANSPDLNPIENVWGLMKKEVEKKNPEDLDSLEEIIQEVWDGLTLDYIKSLIKSMPNRLQRCIDLQGDVTGY